MLPSIGPGAATSGGPVALNDAATRPGTASDAQRATQVSRGQTPAATSQAETNIRVDAATASERAKLMTRDIRKQGIPDSGKGYDPKLPVGPRPAFTQSPLDEARALVVSAELAREQQALQVRAAAEDAAQDTADDAAPVAPVAPPAERPEAADQTALTAEASEIADTGVADQVRPADDDAAEEAAGAAVATSVPAGSAATPITVAPAGTDDAQPSQAQTASRTEVTPPSDLPSASSAYGGIRDLGTGSPPPRGVDLRT